MRETQGTTRERSRAADLALDDIIIEDVSEGAVDNAAPGSDGAGEVVEEISIEELPLDSLEIIDESMETRTPGDRQTGGDVLVDLEALTSEIDRIDSVVPEDKRTPRVSRKDEMPLIPAMDESKDLLVDFDSVAELNLDDMISDSGNDTAGTRRDPAGAAPSGEKQALDDDLPYDLIDDEFIIIEDEGGVRAPMAAAHVAGDGGHGVLDDELVRIHGEMSAEAPGSLIEENLDTAKKPAATPPAEVETPAAREQRKARKSGEITIQIPEKVRKNLPRNFKMSDLRPIDLFEAEKIASEDILLLREEDLIEELDSMDLVPLDDEPNAGELPSFDEDVPADDMETEHETVPEEEAAGVTQEIEAQTGNEESLPVSIVDAAVVDDSISVEPVEQSFAEPVDIVDESEGPAVRGETRGEMPAEPILLDVEPVGGEEERSIEPAESTVETRELPEEKIVVPEETVVTAPMRETQHHAGIGDMGDDDTAGQGKPMPHETVHHAAVHEKAAAPVSQSAVGEAARVIIRESIPAELSVGPVGEKVHIIDDMAVVKDVERSESIFEENDLEKITSNMVEVVEGESKFLREASTEEDQDQIAAIMSGTALAFEDLLIDFEDEYKFSDEETGFIDNSFVSDAYRSHDSSAGGKSVDRKGRKETMALEIFGLTDHEISDIETGVFSRDYKNIDLAAVPGAARPGLDQAPGDYELSRKYQYLGNSAENMNRAEKSSVEEDLSGADAYILEESADDIRRILANYRKKKNISPGGVRDISDEIVIIDDSRDMERFSGTVPAEKRQNVKSLLKYLDGLFEKLPEDVIRKFAESEYYNIYVKVLNELDR